MSGYRSIAHVSVLLKLTALTISQTMHVRACFSIMRQIRRVRLSLYRDALIVLIRALIIGKGDYAAPQRLSKCRSSHQWPSMCP